MAAKKNSTQAQKAVSDAKKKASGGKSGSTAKKTADNPKKAPVVKTEYDQALPANGVIAATSLGLFVLLLFTAVNPDGAVLKLILSFMLGLLGPVGFYFLIPGLLYIFAIHTFGRKSHVRMRMFCTLAFVLLCGIFYHMTLPQRTLGTGIAVIGELYTGGSNGTTGGLICGGLGLILRWAFGNAVSYILLVIFAILSLMGSIRITLGSLIRAIRNRPRDEEDELEEELEEVDPASVVVNHIANRRIEYSRQRRERLEVANQPVLIEESPAAAELPPASQPAPRKKQPARTENPKAADMMSQIDEIESPVVAATEHSTDPVPAPETVPPRKQAKAGGIDIPLDDPEILIPRKMPELELDAPIPSAPKLVAEPQPEETVKPKAAPAKTGKVTAQDAAQSAAEVAAEIEQAQTAPKPAYCFPPIDLLNRPSHGAADGTAEMRENSRRLNETLASFKIDAHIINVTRGPSVTRYEVELDKGVRLNKLTSCADDIALSLGASGVRIAAVPGKISIVGIEVPNRAVTTVSLREVIDSPEFNKSKSKSSFAVGKDIGGSCIVGNIAKMPHMLIAGTTGSGKSVCMNSLISSLSCQNRSAFRGSLP